MDLTSKLSKMQILWWSADRQFKHWGGDQFQDSKSLCKFFSIVSKSLEEATHFAQTKRSNISNYCHTILDVWMETWVWTSDQMKKLEGTQYRFLRTIAGKTWKDNISYVDLINNFKYIHENFHWANTTNKGASITAAETYTYCQLARLTSDILAM